MGSFLVTMLACFPGDLVLDVFHLVCSCHGVAKEPLVVLLQSFVVPTLSHEDRLVIVVGTYGRVRIIHRAGLAKC